uniref:Ganglioside-induced differentiation-associated protein 1 n=1 Tax=Anabas testudineus TaxID=64144 RepID=A0A7N6AJN8_ANATE
MYQNECCFCGVDIFIIIIIIIIIIVKLKGILRACRGGVCILLCCLHLSPTVTADKMASEVMSDSQDEKAALLEKDEQQQSGGAAKQSECKLRLYHWTQSFNSQKVRLAVAEKGLHCEEYDVSLPLSEHNEPWFMHLNPTGEVPVLVHNDNVICDPTQIIDYLEQNFTDEGVPRLVPEEGTTYYHRVQHYRELLDSLQMDAYTHGCILHPEITVDSHIPAYAATCIQSKNFRCTLEPLTLTHVKMFLQSKLFDHDNMKYLKKLLDELENVMEQVETELQRRVEETPGDHRLPWLCGEFFSMADVSLAVTLHRLKFLGLSRRYWGNGNRVNLETYYERVVERPAFRRVLGHVNNILISAVLPVAFRLAKKNAPVIVGTTLLIGLLGGATYLGVYI